MNNNRISEVCAAKRSRTYEYMEPINSRTYESSSFIKNFLVVENIFLIELYWT